MVQNARQSISAHNQVLGHTRKNIYGQLSDRPKDLEVIAKVLRAVVNLRSDHALGHLLGRWAQSRLAGESMGNGRVTGGNDDTVNLEVDTDSFRKHRLVTTDGAQRTISIVQIKIPGDLRHKRLVSRADYDVAQHLAHAPGLSGKVRSSTLVLNYGPGTRMRYGQRVRFTREVPERGVVSMCAPPVSYGSKRVARFMARTMRSRAFSSAADSPRLPTARRSMMDTTAERRCECT